MIHTTQDHQQAVAALRAKARENGFGVQRGGWQGLGDKASNRQLEISNLTQRGKAVALRPEEIDISPSPVVDISELIREYAKDPDAVANIHGPDAEILREHLGPELRGMAFSASDAPQQVLVALAEVINRS